MSRRVGHRPTTAVVLATALMLALAIPAVAAETTLTAALTGGATEVPNPGDPDGSGQATVRIDPAIGRACWSFTTTNVGPGTLSHIHEAPAGTAGPVVVDFDIDGFGESSEGCREGLDAALLQRIVDNPAGFYVNVHTEAHPAGAVRGQLAAMVPNTATSASGPAVVALVGLVALVTALGVLSLARRRA